MTIIPTPADRAEWLALRRKYVGGSEVAALFDAQPGYALSRFALHHIKAGHIEEPEITVERADWGNLLEPVIAEEAGRREGWTVEPKGYAIDDTTPGLGASLDYRIVAHNERNPLFVGPGVLQIKCIDWLTWRDVWGKSPPLYVDIQLAHEMAATGYQWGALAALISGNELHVWKRRARPRLIAAVRNAVTQFWQNIERGIEPQVDASDATVDALRKLYVMKPQKEIEAPPDRNDEAHQMALLLRTEREVGKNSAERAALARNYLLALLGDAQACLIHAPADGGPDLWVKRTANNQIRIGDYG